MTLSLTWSPFLPTAFAVALGIAAVLIFFLAWRRRALEIVWRGGLFLLLALLLLNPIALHEARRKLPDKAVIVVDDSTSEKIAARDKVAQQALDRLTRELARTRAAEPVFIRAAGEITANKGESTRLFSLLKNALPGLPLSQIAG